MGIPSADKRQLNVYVSKELIKRVKHACIDSGDSLSDFVEKALEDYINKEPRQ